MEIQPNFGPILQKSLHGNTPSDKIEPEFKKALLLAQTYSFKLQYGRNLKASEGLIDKAYTLYGSQVEKLSELTGISKQKLKLAIHASFFDPNRATRASGEKNLVLAERLLTKANQLMASPLHSSRSKAGFVKIAADLVINIGTAQKTVVSFKSKAPPDKVLKSENLPKAYIVKIFLRSLSTKENMQKAIDNFKGVFKVGN